MQARTPLFRLKRKAREMSRARKIPLHVALGEIAVEQGFKSWSLLAAENRHRSPAAAIYGQLVPGQLMLAGARPGHGKTLLSLQLAAEAIGAGHHAHFFSLEYTLADVMARLDAIGIEPRSLRDRFLFDDSDDICADYVIRRLEDALPATLVVIDYLQLLDQRRDKPDLTSQVTALRTFARQRALVFVFVSQIDRAFEASPRTMPDLADIRLPNPLDLGLFDRLCFVHDGEIHLAD